MEKWKLRKIRTGGGEHKRTEVQAGGSKMTIGMPGKPRIFVRRSELLLAGVELTFTVSINPLEQEITQEHVRKWLEWGKECGLGEWRHAGLGRFEVISVEPTW